MTIRAFNKVTRAWASSEDGSDLTPPEDWVLNPVFDNEQWAMQIGPEFWTITGSNITTPTQQQYEAVMKERARLRKWREIQEWRDDRIQNGGYKVGNYWFHSDNVSRIQQLGLLMLGANMPPNLMWKTMSGEFVQMTATLAQQVFQAAAASDIAIHAVAEVHRQQVMSSDDPNEYDWKTRSPSWPKVFGE
jgi:hypothetical protein